MTADSSETLAARATLLTWLKLMRLPTVFTALSNILCGYFISRTERDLPTLVAEPTLWLLLGASAGLYLGGMVLNDVFDAELDAIERPSRPIPAGQISRRAAAVFGGVLMVIGIGAAWCAGRLSDTGSTSVVVAIVLAAVIVLYDSLLKNTIAAPLGMGGCRFLNVILGASCSADQLTLAWPGNSTLWIAAGLGVYVFGVTLFAMNEAGNSSKTWLALGLGIALLGIAIDALLSWRQLEWNRAAAGALIALAIVAANITLRCVKAIGSNQPVLLQKTVGFMLLNIIFIDAAMTFSITGSARLATAVVILVIPATLMKRVVPMS